MKRTVWSMVLVLGLLIQGLLIQNLAMGENAMDRNETIKEIYDLNKKDISYDGKSVFWDGEHSSIREDIMDDEDIVGGRFNIYRTDDIVTDSWSVRVAVTDQVKTLEQEADYTYYAGDNWKLEVKRVDFDQSKEYYCSEEGYIDISEEALSDIYQDRYENAMLFMGLSDLDGRVLVGYTYLLRDYFEHEYEVSYYGVGFLEDIFLNASCMGGSFEVLFDLDAWAEEHKPQDN